MDTCLRIDQLWTWTRSFNGAMPFQAWIRYEPPIPDDCVADASMGPCPFRHGYSKIEVGIPRGSPRFNGAMPFQAWIHVLPYTSIHEDVDASMGPCPFRHGYMDSAMFAGALVVASMGPCPFRHGYVRHHFFLQLNTLASMGPCPFRHGYMSTAISRIDERTLQWGHALSGMDTCLQAILLVQ